MRAQHSLLVLPTGLIAALSEGASVDTMCRSHTSDSGNSSRIFGMVNEEIGSRVIGVDIKKCKYDFVYNGVFIYFPLGIFFNQNQSCHVAC